MINEFCNGRIDTLWGWKCPESRLPSVSAAAASTLAYSRLTTLPAVPYPPRYPTPAVHNNNNAALTQTVAKSQFHLFSSPTFVATDICHLRVSGSHTLLSGVAGYRMLSVLQWPFFVDGCPWLILTLMTRKMSLSFEHSSSIYKVRKVNPTR